MFKQNVRELYAIERDIMLDCAKRLQKDCVYLVEENERLRSLLKAASDCLSGHMLGINCHGPSLDDATVREIAKELASMEDA